ncbi:MAG: TonB-dependent receptor [Tannerellaceae bacterium]|jgi:outer membrane receptor protein involved in Fe transport|nr:TonB-dependent receptor [Tannerellaceae bacterium]
MRNFYYVSAALGVALSLQEAKADSIEPNDTIKTYNIGEVVVTSSTKETNELHLLPGSVSLISPNAVAERRINALKDITSLVPNLYIPDYGARLTSAIYIRGVGARSSGQSVGLYVDDAPYPDKSSFDFELADVQRIEVLRGPQGTLYGRNAMGGIVNVYTFSPFDYEGTRLSVAAGNYGLAKAKASRHMKIGDTFGVSLSGRYDHTDGYFTNIHTGRKADAETSAGGRLRLEWRPVAGMSAAYALSYDYVDQGAFPYGLYHSETATVDPVSAGDPSSYNRKTLTNSLRLEYRRPGSFVLSSVTGHQYLSDDMKMDQDFSPLSVFTLNQRQTQKAFSQEIAVKSDTQANYQWSFGIYGFANELHTEGPVTFGADGVKSILQKVFDDLKAENPRMPALVVMDEELYIPGTFDTPARGLALFHQSTYNNLFTRGLSLTAGFRLDYERQGMDYASTAGMRMGISRPSGPAVEIPGIKPTVIDATTSQDFRQFLPKLSLKYECTPRTFTYLSVAKGYKAGGYNVQMSADLMQSRMQYDMMSQFVPALAVAPEPIENVAAYRPEQSWNYELGIRSELVKGRLTSELTFFYTDISDMQITKFVESGNGRILANAGMARSLGAELTVRARLYDALTADVNYGFTRATFSDYVHEQKAGGSIVRTDCRGKAIPYIPSNTLNIGLHYSLLIRRGWIDQYTASTQFSGVGAIKWTELNDVGQPFYGLLNLKTGIRKGIVRLDLWARNLTGASYNVFYFESLGRPYLQKGKPIQIGLDVSVVF